MSKESLRKAFFAGFDAGEKAGLFASCLCMEGEKDQAFDAWYKEEAEWRPLPITREGARRALASAGITADADYQIDLVTAAQHSVLGNIAVFIRNPRDETVTEIDAEKAGLTLLPTSGQVGLPMELTEKDRSMYRAFG